MSKFCPDKININCLQYHSISFISFFYYLELIENIKFDKRVIIMIRNDKIVNMQNFSPILFQVTENSRFDITNKKQIILKFCFATS